MKIEIVSGLSMKQLTTALICVSIILTSFFADAQKQPEILKIIKLRGDSINKILDSKATHHALKLDSLNKTYYIQQLEDISNLQNNRDTYYGAVFGVLAGILTLVAVILGVNWVQMIVQNRKSMKEHSKALTEQKAQSESAMKLQRTESKKFLDQQADGFQAMFKKQIEDFQAVKQDLENLKRQNETAIANSLKLIEDDFKKYLDRQETGGEKNNESLEKEFEKFKLEVDKLKEIVEETNLPSAPNTYDGGDELHFLDEFDILGRMNFIRCSKCNKFIPLEKFKYSVFAFSGTTSRIPVIKCGRCGEDNELPYGALT